MLQIIHSTIERAEYNMQKDADLLESLDPEGSPILHLYSMEKNAITYGCFVPIEQYIDVSKKNLPIVKRPTGGGVIFHACDLPFSFLMPEKHPNFFPTILENYQFVNAIVLKSIEEFLKKENRKPLAFETSESVHPFCMAKPTRYDVLLSGRKVAGAAQRRKKNGYLHQGSIFLTLPDKEYLSSLNVSFHLAEEIAKNSYPLLGICPDEKTVQKARSKMQSVLNRNFSQALDAL